MLDNSADYKNAIYSQNRQFLSRASIKMDAFNNTAGRTFTLTEDLYGKVTASTVENPHKALYVKSSLLREPTYSVNAEFSQAGYSLAETKDSSGYHITGSTAGAMTQAIFRFDVIQALERQYGKAIWGGATLLADKIAIAKTLLTSISATVTGYGLAPVRPVFRNFRYIRDWLNGSTANANNYWNEIQCLAGATNRAAGKTPTISSGTLTNGANITDGNTATYGYEASANGVAKYIKIDLGAVYYDIDTIKVTHYYADGRTFHGTKTEISIDGTNWYPIFDSAVSGEYAETSAGKTYTGSSGGNQITVSVWSTTANSYSVDVVDTGNTYDDVTRTTSGITQVIDSDGMVNFNAWAMAADGTTASELYIDYITCSLTGTMTNIRTYDDNTIMRFSAVEEMSILNDALPANELSLTMDNASGELDLLNFTNMSQVIASKPEVRLEMGLVIADTEAQTILADYANKVRADNTANPNAAWYISGGRNTELLPTDTLTEFSQSAYDSLETLDGNSIQINTTLTSGNYAQYIFSFNIIEILERQLGSAIWRGKTTLAEMVAIARVLITRIDFTVVGFGSSPTGNKAT